MDNSTDTPIFLVLISCVSQRRDPWNAVRTNSQIFCLPKRKNFVFPGNPITIEATTTSSHPKVIQTFAPIGC